MYKINIPTELDREHFMRIFGGVYEHSPWIAEQVYLNGNLDNYKKAEDLHNAMEKIVATAKKEKKIALLRAHPDLAGKLAINNDLTAASQSEQSNADLSNCSPEEFDLFKTLNTRYNKKFGFPFILAVRGYHRVKILEIFKNRINNDVKSEFDEAMKQVHRIALLRLKDIE